MLYGQLQMLRLDFGQTRRSSRTAPAQKFGLVPPPGSSSSSMSFCRKNFSNQVEVFLRKYQKLFGRLGFAIFKILDWRETSLNPFHWGFIGALTFNHLVMRTSKLIDTSLCLFLTFNRWEAKKVVVLGKDRCSKRGVYKIDPCCNSWLILSSV